jgi:uncharacterized membrane protein
MPQNQLKRVRRREKWAWIAALPTVLLLSPILVPFFGIKWAWKRYAKAIRKSQAPISSVMDGTLADGNTSPSRLLTGVRKTDSGSAEGGDQPGTQDLF